MKHAIPIPCYIQRSFLASSPGAAINSTTVVFSLSHTPASQYLSLFNRSQHASIVGNLRTMTEPAMPGFGLPSGTAGAGLTLLVEYSEERKARPKTIQLDTLPKVSSASRESAGQE